MGVRRHDIATTSMSNSYDGELPAIGLEMHGPLWKIEQSSCVKYYSRYANSWDDLCIAKFAL